MISVGFMLFCFVSSSREIVFIASAEKRQLSDFLPLQTFTSTSFFSDSEPSDLNVTILC